MTLRLANLLCDKLIAAGAAAPTQRARLVYGLFCILSGAIQICLLLLLSLLFKIVAEVAVFVIMFASLKRTIGGWHAQRHWTCLIFFTALSITCANVSRAIPRPFIAPLCAIAVVWMLVVVWRRAPVTHYNNPQTEQRIAELKIISRRIALFDFAILLIATALLRGTGYLHLVLSGALGTAAAATALLFPNKPPAPTEKGDG